jgi:hypothetical protein
LLVTADHLPARASAPGRTQRESDSSPRPWLRALLTVDAVGSAGIAGALLAYPGWFAGHLGLAGVGVIQVVGALFVANAIVNAWAARTLDSAAVATSVTIDAVFGVAVLVVALTGPTTAAGWARWALAGLAIVSLDLAVAKAWGRWRGW